MTMVTFLDVNGYEFVEDEQTIEDMFVDLAAGTIDQGEFCGWVVNHSRHASAVERVTLEDGGD